MGIRSELPEGGRLVDERVLTGLRERPWSATSIEKWIGCPVAWFVERLLAPGRFEPDPEPFARGSLAHEALSATLAELGRRSASTRLSPGNVELARGLLRESLAEAEPRHLLSVSPQRALAIRRSLQADLERYLEHAAALEGSLTPREFELGFGFTEEDGDEHGEPSELAAFELGGGVRLRGRIDRIDVGEDGEAIVIDYKGADAPRGKRWIADGKLQVALYMQAAEQLLGVRVVGGLYQPLRGRSISARGALLEDHQASVDCTSTDRFDQDQLDELLAEALDSARAAVGAAGRGELEARPNTCAWKGGCLYPTICRCER
jgi:RecB family exonuclease